jgi:hypothetical protein
MNWKEALLRLFPLLEGTAVQIRQSVREEMIFSLGL